MTPPVSYVNDTKIAHGTQPAFVEEFDVYPRPAAPGSEAGALSLAQGLTWLVGCASLSLSADEGCDSFRLVGSNRWPRVIQTCA